MNIGKIFNNIYNKIIGNSTVAKEAVKKKVKTREIDMVKVALLDSRKIKKPANNTRPNYGQFNDLAELRANISQKARKTAASYPKGSFKRVNETYIEPAGGKKHTIVYEGQNDIDFDITSDGDILGKIRLYIVE